VVLAGLVGGAMALGGAAVTDNLGGGTTTVVVRDSLPATTAPLATPAPPAASSDGGSATGGPSVQAVVARSSPAVVKITVGEGGDGSEGRLGSGFVIRDDGLVLSNSHVVEDAETVTATFEDGTETEARVLGRDESTDLAVLRVEDLPAGVEPLPLGSSLPLVVGDPVIAIGNPFGLERTATTGIVSALKRIIRAPNNFEIQNVIQTDAAINQGNSGGPLLDAAGRVVGINTQIATGSGGNDGIGFAVPVDTLRPIVNAIVRTGEPEHAWVGVTGRTITPAMAEALGQPGVRGVAVVEVDERGPASDAGLRAATTPLEADVPRGGDLIVEVQGRAVTDMADVSRAVSSRAVGDPLEMTVLRDGRRVTLTFTLADRPDDVGVAPRP
jgi:S1-C subfamily serine protease